LYCHDNVGDVDRCIVMATWEVHCRDNMGGLGSVPGIVGRCVVMAIRDVWALS